MFKRLTFCLVSLILLAGIETATAQDHEYHPVLSDNFTATIGWMHSSNSFKAEAEGRDEGDDGDYIDFDDSLGVDDSSTLWNGQLRYKFGRERKWSVFGQYFNNSAEGEAVLTEDIEWDGDVFRAHQRAVLDPAEIDVLDRVVGLGHLPGAARAVGDRGALHDGDEILGRAGIAADRGHGRRERDCNRRTRSGADLGAIFAESPGIELERQ